MTVTDLRIHATIVDLLGQRGPAATICPSEAARALAPEGWREHMPRVREVAVAMANEGVLEIRQRGRPVAADGELHGPIRLGRPRAR